MLYGACAHKDRIYMVYNAHTHTFMHSLRFGCVQFHISDVRNLEFGNWNCAMCDFEVCSAQ